LLLEFHKIRLISFTRQCKGAVQVENIDVSLWPLYSRHMYPILAKSAKICRECDKNIVAYFFLEYGYWICWIYVQRVIWYNDNENGQPRRRPARRWFPVTMDWL